MRRFIFELLLLEFARGKELRGRSSWLSLCGVRYENEGSDALSERESVHALSERPGHGPSWIAEKQKYKGQRTFQHEKNRSGRKRLLPAVRTFLCEAT